MICVDELRSYSNKGRLNGQWCHMVSDTGDEEELHAFARKLGLKREWFQSGEKANLPHYDLRPSKREKAVKLGAREITWRELGAIILRRRKDEGEDLLGA